MNEEPAEEARKLVATLFEECADDLQRPPSIVEVLAVLGYSIPDSVADQPAALPVVFRVSLRKGVTAGAYSRAADLSDAPFCSGLDLMSFISAQLGRSTGRPPSMQDVASALCETLMTSGVAFNDIASADITSLKVATSRRNKRVSAGDLVAIPAGEAGYRLALVSATNQIGVALVFVNGFTPAPRIRDRGAMLSRPVYTDDRAISSGSWKIAGHDEQMLSRVSPDPEIYHRPEHAWPGVKIGPFGSAEAPDGTMRELTQREARDAGLGEEEFRQIYPSSYLQTIVRNGWFPRSAKLHDQ